MSKPFLKAAVTAAAAAGVCSAAPAAGSLLLTMTVNSKAYTIELTDNEASRNFVAQLPAEFVFEDFGSVERIAYLSEKLETGDAPTRFTPRKGDIAYYIPLGNLAVFIGDFRESSPLVPLGKLSDEALSAIKTSGDVKVRFERAM